MKWIELGIMENKVESTIWGSGFRGFSSGFLHDEKGLRLIGEHVASSTEADDGLGSFQLWVHMRTSKNKHPDVIKDPQHGTPPKMSPLLRSGT